MLRLHASATRKIRVPSIDQLFNTSSGNPDLRSEHANGVDVGADYKARDDIERRPLGVHHARARLHRAAVRVAF
jgi:outer membrane cobalamin receptor